MKRKEPSSGADGLHAIRRRQPQVSCDFCRQKKLKCDRESPCASCVVRKLHCSRQSELPSQSSLSAQPNPTTDPALLLRIQLLEEAVFGTSRRQPHDLPLQATSDIAKNGTQQPGPSAILRARPGSALSTWQYGEREQAARFLDSKFAKGAQQAAQNAAPDFTIYSVADGAGIIDSGVKTQPIWIMNRDEAMTLVRDFFVSPHQLLPVVYEPSVRSLLHGFYTRVEGGEVGDPIHAALILSICAITASFFNEDDGQGHIFQSAEQAGRASAAWSLSAMNILKDLSLSSATLEECQARALLAYGVFNEEGFSTRFRFLHGSAVTAARNVSLHLLDSPTAAVERDTSAIREIKRRLWWYIASTDWCLGFLGGPLDGTYNINPAHMNVKVPRNINDADLGSDDDTLEYPPDVLTNVSFFLHRLRFAGLCRAVIDARRPGFPDVGITDFDQVSALDRLFEKALAELPPFLQMGEPIPPDAPRHLALQRAHILMGFHHRRSRLHRPFLFYQPDNPLYQPFREQCTRSARTVILLCIEMLEGSLAINQSRRSHGPSAYRRGLVISEMFMACTMLALGAGLTSARPDTYCASDISDGARRDLARACSVLEAAGKQSRLAAELVQSLTAVLTKYRLKGTSDAAIVSSSAGESALRVEAPIGPQDADILITSDNFENESIPETAGDFDFSGLWDGFLEPMPGTEWDDQLFADLDFFNGTMI